MTQRTGRRRVGGYWRVAVMRKGELQQVENPQVLYDHPVNLFVAGFIGSPAMNLLEARLVERDGRLTVEFGGFTLPVPDEVVRERGALRGYAGREIVVGIRPDDIEDASLETGAPPERRLQATVDLLEALGSEVLVHFRIAARPALTDDAKELVADVGHEMLKNVEQQAEGGETNVVARLNPRTRARQGESIELVVDTRRLHYFDAENGSGIYS